MAEFKFYCSNCGQTIQGDTSYAGKQINCPVCNQLTTVPQPSASPPPGPSSRSKIITIAVISVGAILIIIAAAGLILLLRHRPGLAADWSWNGNIRDSVSNSRATAHGSIQYDDGVDGRALELDGNSYLTVRNSENLDVGKSSGMTIECWVKLNSFNQGPVVEWSADKVSSTGDGVQLWAGETLFANLRDIKNTPHRIESPKGILTTNAFQQVAVTYDKSSGEARLYIDGTIVATEHFGEMTPQTSYPKISIGRRISQPIGLGDNFNGLISNLRIYRRALSSSEIVAGYNSGRAKIKD